MDLSNDESLTVVNKDKSSKSKILKKLKHSTITDTRKKKAGCINPVSITFQNGDVNEKFASKFIVTLTPKTNGTDVEVQTSYGQTFKNSNIDLGGQQKQIIAIRNRKTNKIKLIEIDSALLMNSALLDSESKSITEINYSKDVKTLHKSFGGKKIVTQIEQREKVNINPDLVAHEVTEAVSGIVCETSEPINKIKETESIVDLLPPCHRNASVVSEVYKLNEILQEDELEALKNEIVKKEDNKSNGHSEFVKFCLEEVKKSESDVDNKLAGILFIEILIQFLKTSAKKLSSKNVTLCSFSNAIHSKLLNEFCIKTESSITRPMTMRDKCLCYIIATCLICCNYQIDLGLLATDVSVHLTRLSRLAQIVGATSTSKNGYIFILKTPLPALPKVSKSRRK